MAISAVSDQTAHNGAVLSVSTLFTCVQLCQYYGVKHQNRRQQNLRQKYFVHALIILRNQILEANSVDLNEMAEDEPPDLDLQFANSTSFLFDPLTVMLQ